MADNLTPRQQEILDFIRNSLEVLGAPPTRTDSGSNTSGSSPTMSWCWPGATSARPRQVTRARSG
jgi:hypothetical protein